MIIAFTGKVKVLMNFGAKMVKIALAFQLPLNLGILPIA
jgi:hypothetical protein